MGGGIARGWPIRDLDTDRQHDQFPGRHASGRGDLRHRRRDTDKACGSPDQRRPALSQDRAAPILFFADIAAVEGDDKAQPEGLGDRQRKGAAAGELGVQDRSDGRQRRHAPKITEQQPMEGTERTIAAEA